MRKALIRPDTCRARPESKDLQTTRLIAEKLARFMQDRMFPTAYY